MVEITPQKSGLNNVIEWLKNNLKNHFHFIFAFGIVGIVFAAANFTNPPLFQNTDNFVLFAQEEIKLEQGVQVSSGDLGSNGKIDVEKDNIINGNLFSDKIELDKNTTINGNVSFNKLQIHKESKILGTQTKSVSLPIAILSDISDFPIGTQDFKFEGKDNSLPAGNYRNILLGKNSRLTLNGGTYNLNKLFLKENSVLIFSALTALNIQKELKGEEHVSILPGDNNLKPTDLVVNYLGLRFKNEKVENKDDDEEVSSEFENDKERKEQKEGKIGRPVVFGKNSFLNFKLLAPKASVRIGEESTIRGQILGRKIKVEKDSILSRQEFFIKESDPAKIVEDQGAKFIVNEIIILMTDAATPNDIQSIANTIPARVVGFLPILKISKIEVQTVNLTELNQIIDKLKALNNPFITDVLPNFIFQ